MSLVSTNVLYTAGFFLVDQKFCYSDFRVVNLTQGKLFAAISGAELWVLSPANYTRWVNKGDPCATPTSSDGGLKVSSSGVDIPSNGPYYFVFLSQGDTRYTQAPIAPFVNVRVYNMQESRTAVIIKNTNYSTETTSFSTTVTYTAKPDSFGPIFSLGNLLYVAGIVGLVIGGIADKLPRYRSR